MPQYCQCNGKGRCRGCDCVKMHIVCTNCLSGRLGKCENTSSEACEDVGVSANAAAAVGVAAARKLTTDSNDGPIVDKSPRLAQCALNRTFSLPPVIPMSPPSFTWGSHTSEQITCYISDVYSELVHWKQNVFSIPTGKSKISSVNWLG